MTPIFTKSWIALLLVAVLNGIAAPVTAQVIDSSLDQQSIEQQLSEPAFLRIQNDQDGEPLSMQLAIVQYGSSDSNTTVDLISAVHIADKAYYQELNQRFQQYDALLFELVTPDSGSLPGNSSSNSEPGFNLISMFQGWMKTGLGLSFQLEEVDYSLENMVHADMTASEFSASMEARGESLFTMFVKMWRAGMQQSLQRPASSSDFDFFRAFFSSNREQALKQVVAKDFLEMELLESVLSKGDGSTLLTERNKKALQVLRDEIANGQQKIGIFYGAAHMRDMSKRLASDFGLTAQSITWLDAWDLQK